MAGADKEADLAADARMSARDDMAKRTEEAAQEQEDAENGVVLFGESDLGDQGWDEMEVMSKAEVMLQNAPSNQLDITVRSTPQDLADLGHTVGVELEPTVSQIAFAGPYSGHIVKNQLIPPAHLPAAWQDPAIATPGLPTDNAVENVARYGGVEAPNPDLEDDGEDEDGKPRKTRRGAKKTAAKKAASRSADQK